MSYTPKSDEQLAREGLLEDGTYQFEVAETSDKPSKKGNAMFTLKLHVFGEDGNAHVVYDYIALGNNFGERKLRHAADACKLISIYETGNLKASDFQDKTGQVILKIAEGNADYPMPKNVVVDYVKRPADETVETGALPPPSPIGDDEVPFAILLPLGLSLLGVLSQIA